MKNKINFTFLILLICTNGFGQINEYNYKRELPGIEDQWHKVILPDEIFRKTSHDFSDIRIFGLTVKQDTIEAAYILKPETEIESNKEIEFNLLNESKTARGYYFTFEIPSQKSINQIHTQFGQKNFDWRINLEGSLNQLDWFTIAEDYRILSIKNELTDFQFTKLAFPVSGFRYYRLLIKSDKKPELLSAKIFLNDIVEGNYRNYDINSNRIEEAKQNKQTIIHIDLKLPVPVCQLKIFVKKGFDYYRPITISYLSDSFHSEKGWNYNYTTLRTGTLNSLDLNEFKFNSTVAQKLRIIVDNYDNMPLQIDTIQVKGYVHVLIARFIEPARYFLTYGCAWATMPHYDIERFADQLPDTLKVLKPGVEQIIEKQVIQKTEPLFQNKMWLWIIMGTIISILGWFSLKMIRQK